MSDLVGVKWIATPSWPICGSVNPCRSSWPAPWVTGNARDARETSKLGKETWEEFRNFSSTSALMPFASTKVVRRSLYSSIRKAAASCRLNASLE